jgi:hypothetical protein
MGSSSSSRDPNELSETFSEDFPSSEQDGAITVPQVAEGNGSENSNGDKEKGSELPRADGGRDAWLFLTGCFVFEALIWGEDFLCFSNENLRLEPILTI